MTADHSAHVFRNRPGRVAMKASWWVFALCLSTSLAQAAQFTINGPAGSGEFGRMVVTLPNGNIVVADPGFDAPGPIVNVGAVYLYRPDGTLISTLRGTTAEDRVGGGVVVLANGNYVVLSPFWDNGTTPNVGAVTFGSGTSGITGVVSPTNSLVGGAETDVVGNAGVIALTNGNYVVASTQWDNGATINAGAVTFGSGTSGITGVVSAANSLVGSSFSDEVGFSGVIALTNGSYVVVSPDWDNGTTPNAGAVTFGSGTSGIAGAVSATNSLVGSTGNDHVGNTGVTALTTGSYVVSSRNWDNGDTIDAGAVTFGSGTTGVAGVVSPTNSLVGSTADDLVGFPGVTALTNGNYVVVSPSWDNGATVNAGAVTFGSGTSGIKGVISATNSLVGGTASSFVGNNGVTVLTNGNYVVGSRNWRNGAAIDVGAVTFGSGTTGIAGVVSAINSLVGSTASDSVGNAGVTAGVTALTNGNYVVASPGWNNGTTLDAGAVTFGSGTSGIAGVVSSTNSLVGGAASDFVGNNGVTALTNGNYVVSSRNWDNGAISDVGAVTFGSGTSGIIGVVSATNSLVGSTASDFVGVVTALTNGNYVVRSPNWSNGATVAAGAVTFGSGTSGITGVVSPTNSLVGSTTEDFFGNGGITALTNGNYVVQSPSWDNGANINVGAVTFGSGTSGITGVISATNSLIGSTSSDFVGFSGVIALPNGNYVVLSPFWNNGVISDAGAVTLGLFNGSVIGAITTTHSVLGEIVFGGSTQPFSYDATRNQLAVGQPESNRVVLQRTGIATAISIVGDSPDPSISGQPVTFTANVSASPDAPTDGHVTFRAASGESCVDTTPTATSATTASYSCTITLTADGTTTVIAEYKGSIVHAYSGSQPEQHTVLNKIFGNGFEGP